MYQETLTLTQITLIISGIINLLLVTTIFVMAWRTKKIMKSTAFIEKMHREKAIETNQIIPIKCPDCGRMNYFFDRDDKPVHCENNGCNINLSKRFPEITRIQEAQKSVTS
jgi:ribosomal protein S27E